MKFRAVLNQPSAMRDLRGLVGMLAKVHKEATVLIDPQRMSFVIAENIAQGIPWLWTDIGDCSPAGGVFSEFGMEGVDRLLHNRIVLSVNTLKLAGALAMLTKTQTVRYVKMKLTNRQFPCLTIDLEVPTAAGCNSSVPYRKVTHDVPVSLIAVRDWADYEVPADRCRPSRRGRRNRQAVDDDADDDATPSLVVGDGGTSISYVIGLPSVRSLRTLVDRIKNLSPLITIYYNNTGELSLVIETDQATVASHYRNLSVKLAPAEDGGVQEMVANPVAQEVSCRVSSKQLSMVLGSLQMASLSGGMWCHIEAEGFMNLRADIRKEVTVNCMFNLVAC